MEQPLLHPKTKPDEHVIERRKLGRSPLEISPLGLGCWQFSKGTGLVGRYWPVLSDEDIVAIVRMSLEGGMNWLDTAESYGRGQSERALDRALRIIENQGMELSDVHIATKWWPIGRSANSLTTTIEDRIAALGGRTIDLYQIHQPFSLSSIEKEMKAMSALISNGKIRYAGVSNYSASQMVKAHTILKEYGYELVSNQVKYNLLDRRIEHNGVLAAAKELGITIIAYSPLQQGVLTGKFHGDPTLVGGIRRYHSSFKPKGLAISKPLIDLLEQLGIKYQRTASQVALNWLIHYHGDTVVAIPGASKVKHAVENIGAMRFALTGDELTEISEVSNAVLS
ncbi:aryl-alcohol dehydrogenase-like predicted oxidoreductase [Paenibacillus sp. DS2015]|uniref:aldo/keto reductase n=1 Tax=Paenibacillus sp. DS2015 TaxID=3373917 RepID=UPI003D224C76